MGYVEHFLKTLYKTYWKKDKLKFGDHLSYTSLTLTTFRNIWLSLSFFILFLFLIVGNLGALSYSLLGNKLRSTAVLCPNILLPTAYEAVCVNFKFRFVLNLVFQNGKKAASFDSF